MPVLNLRLAGGGCSEIDVVRPDPRRGHEDTGLVELVASALAVLVLYALPSLLVGADEELTTAERLKAVHLESALAGPNSERANLREADLERANLRDANLERAHLREANLASANLARRS